MSLVWVIQFNDDVFNEVDNLMLFKTEDNANAYLKSEKRKVIQTLAKRHETKDNRFRLIRQPDGSTEYKLRYDSDIDAIFSEYQRSLKDRSLFTYEIFTKPIH